MIKYLIVTLIVLSCLEGCSGKGGTNPIILTKIQMQDVMWDIIEADVFTQQFVKKDTSTKSSVVNIELQNKIFALHKITRADYYRSYDYYTIHPELMQVILDSMSVKAERERSRMNDQRIVMPIK